MRLVIDTSTHAKEAVMAVLPLVVQFIGSTHCNCVNCHWSWRLAGE
jgi:hypothetical protein